jgi:hypothetical protein
MKRLRCDLGAGWQRNAAAVFLPRIARILKDFTDGEELLACKILKGKQEADR